MEISLPEYHIVNEEFSISWKSLMKSKRKSDTNEQGRIRSNNEPNVCSAAAV